MVLENPKNPKMSSKNDPSNNLETGTLTCHKKNLKNLKIYKTITKLLKIIYSK